MVSKDGLALFVNLALPETGHVGPLKTKVEAANTREEATEGQGLHSASSFASGRGHHGGNACMKSAQGRISLPNPSSSKDSGCWQTQGPIVFVQRCQRQPSQHPEIG